MKQAALRRKRHYCQRIALPHRHHAGALDGIDSNIHRRADTASDLLANPQHWRMVDLTFADDDTPAHRYRV